MYPFGGPGHHHYVQQPPAGYAPRLPYPEGVGSHGPPNIGQQLLNASVTFTNSAYANANNNHGVPPPLSQRMMFPQGSQVPAPGFAMPPTPDSMTYHEYEINVNGAGVRQGYFMGEQSGANHQHPTPNIHPTPHPRLMNWRVPGRSYQGDGDPLIPDQRMTSILQNRPNQNQGNPDSEIPRDFVNTTSTSIADGYSGSIQLNHSGTRPSTVSYCFTSNPNHGRPTVIHPPQVQVYPVTDQPNAHQVTVRFTVTY